jgi:hypothetical protein
VYRFLKRRANILAKMKTTNKKKKSVEVFLGLPKFAR